MAKCNDLPALHVFWLGVIAGMYVGLGGLLATIMAAGMSVDAKGVALPTSVASVKFASSAVFPVGLILIIIW